MSALQIAGLDAICGRLVHNAYRLKLGGESIRKVESLAGAKKAAK